MSFPNPLAGALWAHDHGFKVFPCLPNRKEPAVKWKGWIEEATRETIETYGRDNPDANWGIVPGASGMLVLDVDIKNGSDGRIAMSSWPPLPTTLTIRTWSGGLHFYFKGTARPSVGKLGADLDIRSLDSYVLCPGSVVNDRPYTITEDMDPVDCPSFLREKLDAIPQAPRRVIEGLIVQLDTDENRNAAIAYLETAPICIEGKGADKKLFWIFCEVHDRGISKQLARDLVLEHYNPRCNPPWNMGMEHDALHFDEKWENAYTYAENTIGCKSAEAAIKSASIDFSSPLSPIVQNAKSNREVLAVALGDIHAATSDDGNELIKNRFLCRGAGMLFPGPTGVGKSSFIMQAAILFAIGRPLFGLEPATPLTSLIIQAENDEGDLAEMRDGVIAGLNLSPEEIAEAMKRVLICSEDRRTGMDFCNGTIRPLLEKHRPDILWIDPAFAYLGGEATQEVVTRFLRNGINPLVHEFKCGVVIAHHTNKPPSGQQKQDWKGGDFAYLGSGTNEWANWPRAVITLRTTNDPSVFEFRAAKRGRRLRWRDEHGEPLYHRYVAHAREQGVICWRESTAEEAGIGANDNKSGKVKPSKIDLLALVPERGSIAKKALVSKAMGLGMGDNKAKGFISELLDDGSLIPERVPRAGTRPEVRVKRPEPSVSPILD